MSISSLFAGMDISATGLRAQRVRMDVIANNIANANTTRTATGGVYQRQRVVMEEAQPTSQAGSAQPAASVGVDIASVEADTSPPRMVYDPGHPDADNAGFVSMPNVNIISEMVDMIAASRAYEANATALTAAKDMVRATLSIGRV